MKDKTNVINQIIGNTPNSQLRKTLTQGLERLSLANLHDLEAAIEWQRVFNDIGEGHCHCPGREHFDGCPNDTK